MSDLAHLPTEARNPASEHLDELPTLELLQVIHQGDREAVTAVERELPRIAAAVDAIATRIQNGRRSLHRSRHLGTAWGPRRLRVPADLQHAS